MSLSHFNEIADYLAFLGEHPDEVKQLFRDLLISVTNFFRDPETFQALETAMIAPLVRAKEPDAPLRVWSAGCATGEEPYSLGIVLLEHLAAAQKSCPLQIFATDVDEDALEVARQGTYSESIATDVSPERLRRFFTRVDGAYQVSKQLREVVIFARQNLISDAPFSKLDLIVCRNLLIYLEPEVQGKVIAMLHFSLNEGGFLFLGPSETIGRHTDLFAPVSKKWRIYRRIGPARPERVEVPIAAAVDPLVPVRRLAPPSPTRPVNFADMTHRLLLDQFAPPAVLINRKYEILYFFGPTDRYLAVPAGEPTQDLMIRGASIESGEA
jgi:two-component system CheB/CheR fusion protein